MKTRYLSLWLLCSVIGINSAIAQNGIADVRKVLMDQVKAWNDGSVEGYMKGYWNSDSTTFVSGGTVTRGYRGVLARYKKGYDTREKMGKLEFTELSIRNIASDIVIATGGWQLTRAQDQPGGRFTLVLERKPEGWRIVYDHTSSAK
ncbi:MAG: nuclear transport factor 2 family protein [Ignavibacteriales bacterium]|nr:nuclear transport factor 2 family protein [Ignavibacteriales bacterium]